MKNNRKNTRATTDITYPVVTLRQALADGMEGWRLRVIANSLVRIALKGYDEEVPAYARQQCFHAARKLRAIAKQVDSVRARDAREREALQ